MDFNKLNITYKGRKKYNNPTDSASVVTKNYYSGGGSGGISTGQVQTMIDSAITIETGRTEDTYSKTGHTHTHTAITDFESAVTLLQQWGNGDGTNSVLVKYKGNVASGDNSVAMGGYCTAAGNYSTAEGIYTTAIGGNSHTEGSRTVANNNYEHSQGRWNASHTGSTDFGNSGNTLHSVGIGTSGSNRKNAFEIMQNGDVYIYGLGGYSGQTINSGYTLQNIVNGDYTIKGNKTFENTVDCENDFVAYGTSSVIPQELSVIDNLNSTSATDALSAKQGKVLKGLIDNISGGTASSVPWSGITNKPTTIGGYGITDAYTKTEIDDGFADKEHTHSHNDIDDWDAELNNYYTSAQTDTKISNAIATETARTESTYSKTGHTHSSIIYQWNEDEGTNYRKLECNKSGITITESIEGETTAQTLDNRIKETKVNSAGSADSAGMIGYMGEEGSDDGVYAKYFSDEDGKSIGISAYYYDESTETYGGNVDIYGYKGVNIHSSSGITANCNIQTTGDMICYGSYNGTINDLTATITSLQNQITALQNRIAALEA